MNVQIIISEDIEAQQIGQVQLHKAVNPLLVLRVPFIPGGLSFGVTVLVAGIDYSKPHSFEISIIDPTKEDDDINRKLYTTGEQNLPVINGVMDNFNFNLDLKNIPFRRSGTFMVVMNIDGKTHEHEFEVIGNENFNVSE